METPRDLLADSSIEDLLDRWAYWRRRANVLPNAGGGRGMAVYREADEVARHSYRVRQGEESRKVIRQSLKQRIRTFRQIYKDSNFTDLDAKDNAERLEVILKLQPSLISQSSFASLIHGTGFKREPDYPTEERVELAVKSLPHYLEDVIRKNYLNWRTQEENAAILKISHSTFKSRLKLARAELRRRLGCL